jgi:YidC/Oxa1 family membrane protein insertase
VAGSGLTYEDVPGPNTEWTLTEGATLSPGQPVTLRWDSPKGLVFTRKIEVDDKFLFTVIDTVQNPGAAPVSLQPYGMVARHGLPEGMMNFFILHEGVVGRADGELTETDYADITELPVVEREAAPAEVTEVATDGWLGFTDHYWMTVMVPEQGQPHTQVIKHVAGADIYQTEVRKPVLTVAPGATASSSSRLFAGAKEWAAIRGSDPGLHRLDRLGLVLLPDQADLRRAALAACADRQHGLGHHRADLRPEDHRAAAGLQVLCLDGADERASARDGGDQGTRG